ncbi:MAG TPA: hypothetical protein VF771_15435 [Longimicrobiaceae bacterium]
MRPRTIAATLAVAALAACSDATGGDALAVTFTPVSPAPGPAVFSAESTAPGTITVYGGYTFGGCDEVQSGAWLRGGVVILRVKMDHHRDQICPAFIARFGYRADIAGVPAGSRHLRVEYDGTLYPPAGVQLETDVLVQ